jgi:plastocyanin
MQSPYESSETPFVSGATGNPYESGKKKLWLVVAIVAVVIIGAVVAAVVMLRHGNSPVQQPATAISSTVANVTIEPTGYMPKTIKVKQGQEITWSNKDTSPHHITADQTELPGFDTAEALEPGDTYTYIFDKSGTYHYYDPADPKTFVGTVTVE